MKRHLACGALAIAALLAGPAPASHLDDPLPKEVVRKLADDYARTMAVECTTDKERRYRCVGQDGTATVTFEQRPGGMERMSACPSKNTDGAPCLTELVPRPARRQNDLRIADLLKRAQGAPVRNCRLIRPGEHLGQPARVELVSGGYVCFAEQGDLRVAAAEIEGPSIHEFLHICQGPESAGSLACEGVVVKRPPSRTADLVRFDAINVYAWRDESRLYASSEKGVEYAQDFETVADEAITACSGSGAPAPQEFVWAGRVAPDGAIAISKVQPESPFAQCVQDRLRNVQLKPPPYGDCCSAVRGGYPISLEARRERAVVAKAR
jgi:hypothetical protein